MELRRTLLSGIALLCVCLQSQGQVDLRNIEFRGRVTESGKGIAGVPVTDGQNIVVTDARGNYRLVGNPASEYIYLTLPAGYKVPEQGGAPCLYRKTAPWNGKPQRFDFALERSGVDETKHLLVVWADPQVYFDEDMDSVRRAVRDVKALLNDKYPGMSAVGVVCGDIIGDIHKQPSYFEPMKEAVAGCGIPFFFAVGNHDMDLNVRTNDGAKDSFKSHFGPTYYSFNRGQVHYVVLDDNFFIARDYLYVGYLEERQMKWLEQDLALVPEGSTVVVCFHIPTWSREARSGNWGKESDMKVMNNRRHLYGLLKPYNAHLMSAHEHYAENYVLGEKLFEHVHAPLSTLFWQAPWSMDGVPAGYMVYEVDGSDIEWYWKCVGKDRSRQFSAYPVGANKWKPDAVTVNVWNYDPAWKVFWYEDGVKQGQMTQYKGYDPSIYGYVSENSGRFKFKYIGSGQTEHLFYAVPRSADAAVKVEVVDRFGNSYVWETGKNE